MSLCYILSRLSLGSVKQSVAVQSARSIALNTPLYIRPTQCLYREPLRKKKKLDPSMMKAKEERKKRKIEKEIKRLQKNALTLKPIEEMQLPLQIQDQRELRKRKPLVLKPEESERRVLLIKEWSRRRNMEYYEDVKMLDRIEYSQQLALNKLREESEELYEAAIMIDENLIPIEIKGPTVSPPIKNYDSPDGDFSNTSFKWG